MNDIVTNLNKGFRWIIKRRPVSHAAAVTLLGTSIYGVHEGAASVLPAGLVAATTAAMLGAEWLQWTALGRLARLEQAKDSVRANVLKAQCAGIGALQVALYTLAVVNYAREAGLNWSEGPALFLSIGFALLFAGLNFVAKWTSCEPIETSAPGRPPGLRTPAAKGDNVYDFTRAARDVAGYSQERREVARIFAHDADAPARTVNLSKRERNARYYREVVKPRREAARLAAAG
jgi:hypothetical protein